MTDPIMITTFAGARTAFRQKNLQQDQYRAGGLVMDDVLVNLHGTEHRNRRRIENRLFRRDTFELYERELFPVVIEQTLAPYLKQGRAELVYLGHQMMLNLAALTAGVDRPLGTPEETERLHEYLMVFVEAATLEQYVGDREAAKARILAALDEWDAEFLAPSIRRRQALLDAVAAGRLAAEDLPRDVLTTLLRYRDELDLTDGVIRRETAFFLLAAAHTSATAFGRAIYHILKWCETHPEDRARVHQDQLFVQRCVHEMVRLNPSSPVAMRVATEPVTLDTGEAIPAGGRLVVDLGQVNRDQSVFGPDAAAFDPYRQVPVGVAPFGLSFGAGMHVCIGQDMAAGVVGDYDLHHLFGLVTIAVQRMFAADVRFDPDHPPVADGKTVRPYWAQFPVLLDRPEPASAGARVAVGEPTATATESPAGTASGRVQVVVDSDICISTGKCVADEPTGFAFDADEIAVATDGAAGLPEARLIAAARNCPSGAITVLRGGRAVI
ncbi:MAG TPA: cytochrome P450 [Trebonia sp.]|jgi:cytochrome P450/ferredoxin|nr:cytochrome P450 [Trebonia sp.]